MTVTERSLLKEEADCLQFLQKQHPEEVDRFLEYLPEGRRGIVKKLSDAYFRENIDGAYEKAAAIPVKTEGGQLNRAVLPSMYNGLQGYDFQPELTYRAVTFGTYGVMFAIDGESAFQRVHTTGEVVYFDAGSYRPVETASELSRLLFSREKYPNVDTFLRELNNGAANLTLALMNQEQWATSVREEAAGRTSTIEYALSHFREPSLFFEQLVTDGHHLHPGAKTKLGLSYSDVLRYSPEFRQSFALRFVAVRQNRVIKTTQASLLADCYPECLQEAGKELAARGLPAQDYEILPVHPWQFEHAIPDIYKEECASGDVVLLPGTVLPVDATSSFRTVTSKKKGAPVLKLAVNSQMTSTVRSISTQTALNTTVFSEMLAAILEREPQLDGFLPLYELGGAAFHTDDRLKSRNLTMLIRESIDDKLEQGEAAVAGMALYAKSPMYNGTIIQEIVENSPLSRLEFFIDYVEKVLPGYLTLMVKYGVALEGHLQNSIPVFKDGRLTRFFFRDWGGARIYTERLRFHGMKPAFAPDSVSITNDISDMHNKLYYTVFQNHFGEIIKQLVTSSEEEAQYWKAVREVSDRVLTSLMEDAPEAVETDRAFLYQPAVMHKSLATMRLTASKGYGYNAVPNPLAKG